MADNNKKKEKKKSDESVQLDDDTEDKKDGKTIIVGARDIESLVLDSVSDLLEKGVLVETEDGHKIDLKSRVEVTDDKKEKKKARKTEIEESRE